MSKGYFIEKSRYPIWPIVGITFLMVILFILGVFKTDAEGFEVWVSLGIVAAVGLLFLSIKLDLRVDVDGIQLRFTPFVNKQQHIRWSELSEARVRISKPLREFGGWGYRLKFKTRAYTLYGKWGLEITFKEGKSLFIGVQDYKELIRIMEDTVYPRYPELNRKIEQAERR